MKNTTEFIDICVYTVHRDRVQIKQLLNYNHINTMKGIRTNNIAKKRTKIFMATRRAVIFGFCFKILNTHNLKTFGLFKAFACGFLCSSIQYCRLFTTNDYFKSWQSKVTDIPKAIRIRLKMLTTNYRVHYDNFNIYV